MSNESELTSGIDWENDEAVVRAAYDGGSIYLKLIRQDGWGFRTWRDNRANNPRVVAFEQQNRPSAPQDESLRIVRINDEPWSDEKMEAFKPVAPDSGKGFEEWYFGEGFAQTGCLRVARAAWDAALDSKPEGESKVTWRVDARGSGETFMWRNNLTEFGARESMKEPFHGWNVDLQEKYLVKIETYETVVETRKRGE